MLYAANALCMPIPFCFLIIPFVTLPIALEKHPFVVHKKETAKVAINSQKQQPS